MKVVLILMLYDFFEIFVDSVYILLIIIIIKLFNLGCFKNFLFNLCQVQYLLLVIELFFIDQSSFLFLFDYLYLKVL